MRTIVHPATIVEVKYAYMRLLTNVYAQSDVCAEAPTPVRLMPLRCR